MSKTHLYSFITLSFCSGMLDFMLGNDLVIFPRDRIIHLCISLLLGYIAVYAIENINFNKIFFKYIAVIFILWRAIFLMYKFTGYFNSFHGSNTVGIVGFTVVSIIFIYRFKTVNIKQMYGFFVLFNAMMLVLILVLSAERLNVMNIYSNELVFVFNPQKMYLFFDVLTLAVLVDNKKDRIYAQKRYLYISVAVFVGITLIQGLSVDGNILYSLSPLQSLAQVYSGTTVKRYDYILTVFHTLNFFASITLYVWSYKKLSDGERQVENN